MRCNDEALLILVRSVLAILNVLAAALLCGGCIRCIDATRCDAGVDGSIDAGRDAGLDARIGAPCDAWMGDAARDSAADAARADAQADASIDGHAADGGADGGCTPCRILAPQCGCPEGTSCHPEYAGAHVCRTAGSYGLGSACVVHYDCRPTLACHQGACVIVCEPPDAEDRCEGPYSACVHWDDSHLFASCNIVCEPETSLQCGAALACRIRTIAGYNYTHCGPEGTRSLGQSCTSEASCQRTLTCVSGPLESTCRRICSRSSTSCTCDFSRARTVNGVTYGYCT